MNPYFEKLGRAVAEQWQQQNFSLDAFPEIAQRAMQDADAPLSENLPLAEMIQEFLSNDAQPPQSHSGFGQPELIAFSDPRFYIQILFWMEGTTKIHQHGFSGAFHVMHGSSVHSEFEFNNAKSITPHLRVGDLQLKQIELLETGRTIPIQSGRKCIHSLFHLDSPSVTVVIRTQHDPGTDPQFNYLPPHLAIDPNHTDALTMKRNQLLDVLETIEPSNCVPQIIEMLEELDFERGFHTLLHNMDRLQETGAWENAITTFQNKHGELAAGIPATLAEHQRREYISQLRHYIENPEHRFFLALLMNIQNGKDIATLITKRFPNQPAEDTILRWAEELIEHSDYGLTLLDAEFPETLDIPVEEQFELFLNTLKHSLKAEQDSPTPEQNEIKEALANSCLRPLFS